MVINSFNRKSTSISLFVITYVAFALRALNDGMLAFFNNDYMPFLGAAMNVVTYLTLPLGIIYLARRRINRSNLVLVILPVTYLLFLIANTYNGYSGNWITSFIAIFCFVLFNDKDKASIFNIFRKIVIATSAFSVLIYLFYFIGGSAFFEKVHYYNNDSLYYQKFFIFGILEEGVGRYRLCGIFNEPGGLGTTCALVYAFSHRNNKLMSNIFLILAILFSFSMAGYVIIFGYYFLYLLRKNYKYAIFLATLIIIFFSLPNIDFHNDFLNSFFDRFTILENGFKGDDRTGKAFDSMFASFLNSDNRYFGFGSGYRAGFGESSYKQLILEFGIIGFAILIFEYISVVLFKANKQYSVLSAGFLFLLSIYQRPLAISCLFGYVILLGGIEYLKLFSSNKNNSFKLRRNLYERF